MEIDPKYLKAYKKADSFERLYKKLIIPLLILEMVLYVIGIVVSANYGFLLILITISYFAIPLATIFSFLFVQNVTCKKQKGLEKELFDTKMLADDILKFGKENGIDLYLVALWARCFHELGWIHVPEWCEKDRIMPTINNLENQ